MSAVNFGYSHRREVNKIKTIVIRFDSLEVKNAAFIWEGRSPKNSNNILKIYQIQNKIYRITEKEFDSVLTFSTNYYFENERPIMAKLLVIKTNKNPVDTLLNGTYYYKKKRHIARNLKGSNAWLWGHDQGGILRLKGDYFYKHADSIRSNGG
ncbi:MAG TPA: hypothetical protein PLE75_05045 [Ferruginibacter sp.]|nr:hypothetical protein [Ferruginibacter sp.]HRO97052.1 hypothetical protein [Ferruginibacter sp.]